MQQAPEQPNKKAPNQPAKKPLEKEDEILIQPETPKESVPDTKESTTPTPEKKDSVIEAPKKSVDKEPITKTPKESISSESKPALKPITPEPTVKSTTEEQPVTKEIPFTPVSKEIKSGKSDFLKHIDIRTMTKDIAKLRKEEAKKERERIDNLANKKTAKIKDEKDRVIANSLISGDHAKTKEIKLPRAPSRSDKLYIRILVILFLIFTIGNIIGFTYYYFFVLNRTTGLPEPVVQEQPKSPVLVIPNSFIIVNKTIQFSFTQKEEIPQILSGMLDAQRENGFIRIVLEDLENNKVIQLSEFFSVFNIDPSTEILTVLEEDFTLFLYTNEGRKRLGLVAQGKEGVTTIAIDWEQTIEQDTKELFNIIGEKGQGYVANFRTATINSEIVARFQTLSLNDLGIVYGIVDNKFILTSSLKSIEDIIQKLR